MSLVRFLEVPQKKDPICIGSFFLYVITHIPWDSLTFCIAQKVTKTLVAQKTHLGIRSFVWLTVLLERLFVLLVLFLLIVEPLRVLIIPETGPLCGSDSFERQDCAYSR